MNTKPKPDGALPSVKVTLNGRPVVLGSDELSSLGELKACLERLARRHERVLVGLSIEATAICQTGEKSKPEASSPTPPKPPIAPELTEKVMDALRARLGHLRERVEELALLATINEWPAVERMWWTLLPELRGSLLNVTLLADAQSGIPLTKAELSIQLNELERILKNLSDCLAFENCLQFSDILDGRLSPWLWNLDAVLVKTGC